MNEIDDTTAMRVVEARLLGPDSLPLQVHGGQFVNEAEVAELCAALQYLVHSFHDRADVPKRLALALVDVSAKFQNRFYSQAQQERLEDIAQEVHRLAEELFSAERDIKVGKTGSGSHRP